jgi:aquaporin-1
VRLVTFVKSVALVSAGMVFFVVFGCGTAVGFSNDANVLTLNASFGISTAMAFGMGILTMAYAIGHVSGCHLNPAVTLGLVLSGNCNVIQGFANVVAQFGGSIVAALILDGMNAAGSSLGSNGVQPGYDNGQAYLGEIIMTAALVFVVHMTVCDPECSIAPLAPLAIGFTVFLGHTVLLSIDGCSINPARSFGPALISGTWKGIWIFLTAPLIGAVLAVMIWLLVSKPWNRNATDLFQAHDSSADIGEKP